VKFGLLTMVYLQFLLVVMLSAGCARAEEPLDLCIEVSPKKTIYHVGEVVELVCKAKNQTKQAIFIHKDASWDVSIENTFLKSDMFDFERLGVGGGTSQGTTRPTEADYQEVAPGASVIKRCSVVLRIAGTCRFSFSLTNEHDEFYPRQELEEWAKRAFEGGKVKEGYKFDLKPRHLDGAWKGALSTQIDLSIEESASQDYLQALRQLRQGLASEEHAVSRGTINVCLTPAPSYATAFLLQGYTTQEDTHTTENLIRISEKNRMPLLTAVSGFVDSVDGFRITAEFYGILTKEQSRLSTEERRLIADVLRRACKGVDVDDCGYGNLAYKYRYHFKKEYVDAVKALLNENALKLP